MTKGLDLILEKIRAQPTGVLVSRYLALIAELADEAEKTQRALDLAQVLVQPKPVEALRIAYMVHQGDQQNLRALDLMIEALEARGRFAKAEVLRNERAKLAPAPPQPRARRAREPAHQPPPHLGRLDELSLDREVALTDMPAELPAPVKLEQGRRPPPAVPREHQRQQPAGTPGSFVANDMSGGEWLEGRLALAPESGRHVPDLGPLVAESGGEAPFGAVAPDVAPGDTVLPFADGAVPLAPSAPMSAASGGDWDAAQYQGRPWPDQAAGFTQARGSARTNAPAAQGIHQPSPGAGGAPAREPSRTFGSPASGASAAAEANRRYAHEFGDHVRTSAAPPRPAQGSWSGPGSPRPVDAPAKAHAAGHGSGSRRAAPAHAAPARVPEPGLDVTAAPMSGRAAGNAPTARVFAPPSHAFGQRQAAPGDDFDSRGRAPASAPAAAPRRAVAKSFAHEISTAKSPPAASDGDRSFGRYGERTALLPSAGAHATAPAPAQARPQAPPVLTAATPLPPPGTGGGFAVLIDLVDRYLQLGYLGEARELLRQTEATCGHEDWWRVRQGVLATAESRSLPLASRAVLAPFAGVASEARLAPPLRGDDFWRPLQAELGRLAQSSKSLLVPMSRVERLKTLLASGSHAKKLPDTFVRSLVELDHRLPGGGGERLLQLKWDLLQGLFGSRPDLSCAAVLEELGLTRASTGFWGFYLDALLGGGNARKALVEIRRGLAAQPYLPWAHVAWRRLPLVWNLLRVHGFPWAEDDGVPALKARLAVRPRPRLSSLIVARSGK